MGVEYADRVKFEFIQSIEEEVNEPIVVGKIYTADKFKFWKDNEGYYHFAKCIPGDGRVKCDKYAIVFLRLESDGFLSVEGSNEYKSFDKAKEAYDKIGR